MTHLTIETVECPACGHTHQIEVDTEKAMKEAKEKFERQHKDCKQKEIERKNNGKKNGR